MVMIEPLLASKNLCNLADVLKYPRSFERRRTCFPMSFRHKPSNCKNRHLESHQILQISSCFPNTRTTMSVTDTHLERVLIEQQNLKILFFEAQRDRLTVAFLIARNWSSNLAFQHFFAIFDMLAMTLTTIQQQLQGDFFFHLLAATGESQSPDCKTN